MPLLPGAADLAAAGFVSGGTRANTARMSQVTMVDRAVPAEAGRAAVRRADLRRPAAGRPARRAPALLGDLRARGLPAALIGQVVPGEPGHIDVDP